MFATHFPFRELRRNGGHEHLLVIGKLKTLREDRFSDPASNRVQNFLNAGRFGLLLVREGGVELTAD